MTDVTVLQFEETEPATLPTWPGVDSNGDPTTITPEAYIWRRIEAYTSRRWSTRQCAWVVSGPGDWRPHLLPAENFVVSIWDDDTKTWGAVTVEANPVGGFYLPKCATYKITADIGANAGDVPPSVIAAYERLSQYMTEAAADSAPVGAASYGLKLGSGFDETVERNPNFLARAMVNSGAGDLLRGYRSA